MKTPSYVIKLNVGMDDLLFGSSFDSVKAVLGDPTEVESFEKLDDDEEETILCSYNNLGLTLFFEGDEALVLTSIETDNQESTLFGKKIFGMSENEIIALMNDNGFSEIDKEHEEWGEDRISFDDALADFYFENGKLVTMNWGILLHDEEDDD